MKYALKDDVKRFINEMGTLTESGDLDNADAVLQVSGSANYDLYNELRGDEDMCEVMHRLLKDEIDKKCDEAMDLLEISESQRKVILKSL